MKGYPKHINSKQDVINLLVDYPSETKVFLQGLLDSKENWFFVSDLENDNGINDDMHKVVENKKDDVITYAQYELREDINAYLFKLGFTVDEVRELIKANQGVQAEVDDLKAQLEAK